MIISILNMKYLFLLLCPIAAIRLGKVKLNEVEPILAEGAGKGGGQPTSPRIYCFTFVTPKKLSQEDVSPQDLPEFEKILPKVEEEWGRIPQLHKQMSKCDGYQIYSNETGELDVQGLDPASYGMPISGPQLRYIGSAATYLSIWGHIINTPSLRDGFDWYVMLDSDSFLKPKLVRSILGQSKFNNGMWQVGERQEWAVNAAMLKEMVNQWTWLNDRYTNGFNAGCPKWLLDDTGTKYGLDRVIETRPWVHCAQDVMQAKMPAAMNSRNDATHQIQKGGDSKWYVGLEDIAKGDIKLAIEAVAKDCAGPKEEQKYCDHAIYHGAKKNTSHEALNKLFSVF